MWIARDNKSKILTLFTEKPKRENGYWETEYGQSISINSDMFPNLKWEDEPKEVYLNTGYDMANQINHVWAMLKCTQDELDKANQTVQYYRTRFNALEKIINDR